MEEVKTKLKRMMRKNDFKIVACLISTALTVLFLSMLAIVFDLPTIPITVIMSFSVVLSVIYTCRLQETNDKMMEILCMINDGFFDD